MYVHIVVSITLLEPTVISFAAVTTPIVGGTGERSRP